MLEKKKMTNMEYYQQEWFKLACFLSDITATKRQASKYRNKKGSLYKSQRA